MDSRGQAYSTFQLLIAAVVAMAILAILIPIIMQVMGLITANPTDETRSLLGSLIDAPGSLRTTKVVSFSPGTDISGSSLAEKVALGKNQICMSTGEFPTDAEKGFECLGCDSQDATQQRLIYHGTTNITAKIAVVCNKWVEATDDGLAADLADHKLVDLEGAPDILESCGNICKPNAKCCAIVIKRA